MSESGFRQTCSDYGPQTEQVVALLDRLAAMTGNDARRLAARRMDDADRLGDDARVRVWFPAPDRRPARADAMADAMNTVWRAANYWPLGGDGDMWEAAANVAANAAVGLVLRDIIDPVDYRTLTDPVASVLGRLHPDDPEVAL